MEGKKAYYRDQEYRHNPSSASIETATGVQGACLRQLWWRAKKEPETNPMELTGMLQAGFGDAIHTFILGKLKRSKQIQITAETGGRTYVDDLTKEISYRLDGLVTYEGAQGGFELKTTQGMALTGKGWGIKDSGPKTDHLLQVICYFKVNPALKWFSLVYVARDSGYRLEFHIIRNGDKFFVDGRDCGLTFANIAKRWKELEGFIERNELPPRDYKVWLNPKGEIQDIKQVRGEKYKSDFRCLYCSFKNKCWTAEDAKHAAYKTEEMP